MLCDLAKKGATCLSGVMSFTQEHADSKAAASANGSMANNTSLVFTTC